MPDVSWCLASLVKGPRSLAFQARDSSLLLLLSTVAALALVALEGLLVTGRSAGVALPSVCRQIKRKVVHKFF